MKFYFKLRFIWTFISYFVLSGFLKLGTQFVMYYKLRCNSTQFVIYYKLRNYYKLQRNKCTKLCANASTNIDTKTWTEPVGKPYREVCLRSELCPVMAHQPNSWSKHTGTRIEQVEFLVETYRDTDWTGLGLLSRWTEVCRVYWAIILYVSLWPWHLAYGPENS